MPRLPATWRRGHRPRRRRARRHEVFTSRIPTSKVKVSDTSAATATEALSPAGVRPRWPAYVRGTPGRDGYVARHLSVLQEGNIHHTRRRTARADVPHSSGASLGHGVDQVQILRQFKPFALDVVDLLQQFGLLPGRVAPTVNCLSASNRFRTLPGLVSDPTCGAFGASPG